MEPSGLRRIRYPRMAGADVIRDLILNNLNTASMRLIHKFSQKREGAEMFFNAVVIHGTVTVVTCCGLATVDFMRIEPVRIVVDRGHPESGNPQRFEIRKMIDDSLEIAAMVKTRLASIEQTARNSGVIVRGIAIGESGPASQDR